MGVIVIARVLITLVTIGNGWVGPRWHIGYTVSQRFFLFFYFLFFYFFIFLFFYFFIFCLLPFHQY